MNNFLYAYTHPKIYHARPQKTCHGIAICSAPVQLPQIRFQQRTLLTLLVIGIVSSLPTVLAQISPSITDPCSNGTWFIPTGYGSVTPASGDTATTFTFTATMTGCTASGNGVITWNFGDGTTATGDWSMLQTTHTYNVGGTFTWSFSWHYVAGAMGPSCCPGTDNHSGTVTVAGHWTNGDWSLERSQSVSCVHQIVNGAITNTKWCMS